MYGSTHAPLTMAFRIAEMNLGSRKQLSQLFLTGAHGVILSKSRVLLILQGGIRVIDRI